LNSKGVKRFNEVIYKINSSLSLEIKEKRRRFKEPLLARR